MIKIVATITDLAYTANIGGDPDKTSVIIEVPTRNVPHRLKEFLEAKPELKKWATLSFSLLDEDNE